LEFAQALVPFSMFQMNAAFSVYSAKYVPCSLRQKGIEFKDQDLTFE
jgi:hypothetical protein